MGKDQDAAFTGHVLLDDEEMARALRRMAHQVAELAHGTEGMMLLGVPTRGVELSRRLKDLLEQIEGTQVPQGELDITMYRDDLRANPTRTVGRTRVPGPVEGRTVVLVDDVLNSGRTVLAALDAIKDLGRPARVMLAVLVDRGHREVPVQADVVGLEVRTARNEKVKVRLAQNDGRDVVLIEKKDEEQGTRR